jgi:hypothetical protein
MGDRKSTARQSLELEDAAVLLEEESELDLESLFELESELFESLDEPSEDEEPFGLLPRLP